MSYQNVGTPRFYVNIYEYLESIGALSIPDAHSYLRTNPTKTFIQKGYADNDGYNNTTIAPNSPIALGDLIGDKGFVALLGHNMASCNAMVKVQEGNPDYTDLDNTEIINFHPNPISDYAKPENDGFTIFTGGFNAFDQTGGVDVDGNDIHSLQFRWESGTWGAVDTNPYNGIDLICNSAVIGNYYDMPYSPDLSLKLTFEYDGVKTMQTKGGATLSNATYTKPADWGDGGAWQLGSDVDGNPVDNLRSGRRVWDLSFSYISDSHLMPMVAGNSNIGADADDTTLLNGSDFFSMVWNRTLGGHLPFIFQADGSNSDPAPDQFSICRFDMKSLEYKQVALNTYSVSLKIREVW